MHEYLPGDTLGFPTVDAGKLMIDISCSIETKMNAYGCHRSQVSDDPQSAMHPDNVRAFARYRGSLVGVDYAECFHLIRMIG